MRANAVRPFWHRPAVMVWVGLFARELAIFIGHTYRISRLEGSFGFGWETGRIARSIALGQGFSAPFVPGTGPTAWLAPIYPYLLAGVFKIFGVYTTASSIAILSINSVFSAVTILPVFYAADRVFGRRVALWSGWLAALFPYAWYWAIKWAWETSLATLLLACVFALSIRMAGIGSEPGSAHAGARPSMLRDWLLFGLLWGLIALVNPSLLLWLPFVGLWLLWKQSGIEGWSRSLTAAIFSGVVFLALLAPWTVRNYLVFHKLIPVRGNFWVELRLGNADNAVGLWRFWMHPSSNVLELRKYEQMGEVAYVQSKKSEALDFIRRRPAFFLQLCLRRAVYFWYGTPRDSGVQVLTNGRNLGFLLSTILSFAGLYVMWRRGNPAAYLFGTLLLAAPFLYYLTFPHPRYRAPIEPEMLILMSYVVLAAEPRRRRVVVPETAESFSRSS